MIFRWFLSKTVRQASAMRKHVQKTPQPPARHPVAGRPSQLVQGALLELQSAIDDRRRKAGPGEANGESGDRSPTNGSSPIPTPPGARTWRCCWSRSPWRWASARSSCNRSRFHRLDAADALWRHLARSDQRSRFQDSDRLGTRSRNGLRELSYIHVVAPRMDRGIQAIEPSRNQHGNWKSRPPIVSDFQHQADAFDRRRGADDLVSAGLWRGRPLEQSIAWFAGRIRIRRSITRART